MVDVMVLVLTSFLACLIYVAFLFSLSLFLPLTGYALLSTSF